VLVLLEQVNEEFLVRYMITTNQWSGVSVGAAHARKQHLFPSSKQNDDIFSHLEIRRV
jgi:hypothetical protein